MKKFNLLKTKYFLFNNNNNNTLFILCTDLYNDAKSCTLDLMKIFKLPL